MRSATNVVRPRTSVERARGRVCAREKNRNSRNMMCLYENTSLYEFCSVVRHSKNRSGRIIFNCVIYMVKMYVNLTGNTSWRRVLNNKRATECDNVFQEFSRITHHITRFSHNVYKCVFVIYWHVLRRYGMSFGRRRIECNTHYCWHWNIGF